MKKLLTAIMLMIMSLSTVSAQRLGDAYVPALLDHYDSYLSARVGYNVASLRMTPDDISGSSISGFNFGLIAGFPLNNTSVIFETGVILTAKGGKTIGNSKDHPTDKIKNEVHMYGFEIPIVFKYDFEIPSAQEFSFQPLFGGFVNLGHNGKIKNQDGQERNKFKTYSGRFKRLDAGLRMGCGVTLNFFYAELVYNLGLVNLAKDKQAFRDIYPTYDDFEDTAKTGTLSINFGVNF